MSTRTKPAPLVSNSDAAMIDAQVQPPAPHELTKETRVSATTWNSMSREDKLSHVAKLRRTHDTAARTKQEMVANLVLVAARMYRERPEKFQAKNGNFKGSALVNDGLGLADLSVGSDIRTAINKCVPAVVDSGLKLYGEPSAKLVALLNAYDTNEKHRKARERNRAARNEAKSEDRSEGETEDKSEAKSEAQAPKTEPVSWAKAQVQAVALAETVAALEGTSPEPESEQELVALLERTIEAIRSN